jgi:tRNA A-37 threonylcarbamoyl transferase component Bud32/dienelactone hydrolase
MTGQLERLQAALAGRYAIERELGAGGMATVYLAHDVRHDRKVAVKVLHPQLTETLGLDRFDREIKISARLQHPNILTLIDSGEAAGLFYYVMPFVEGESLRDRLDRERPLPLEEAVRYVRDVVDALSAAHAQQIVHRDIKPANILISGRHALVTDFGVAKALREAREGPDLTTAGLSLGTPTYMAPEQAAGDPNVDHRADLYAVGVLAYELLVGRPPFEGPTAQAIMAAHLTTAPPPISDARQDVPPLVASVVSRCLAKAPEDRHQSAEQLRGELDRALASLESGTTVAQGKRRRRIGVSVAAAAAIVLLIAWLAGRGARERVRWARAEALPQIAQLVEDREWEAAYQLALEAERAIPDDPELERHWSALTRRVDIVTVPVGAEIRRRAYGSDRDWEVWGTTPLESIPVPLGVSRIRIERAGFEPRELVVTWQMLRDTVRLDSVGAVPEGMIAVPGGSVQLYSPGVDHLPPVEVGDFFIDKYEVTNEQFKRFVDAGGYSNPAYWPPDIEIDGRTVAWSDAARMLVDRTGRPGPSTWEAGTYPDGQERHPVGGVSWYEAAAYARFVGKALPTIYHWGHVADVRLSGSVTPQSNIARDAIAPVGQYEGVTRFGAMDMAGNVREWVYNADRAERYILGGGATDFPYAFNDAISQPPSDRSAINGIRLVTYLDSAGLDVARRPIDQPQRDFLAEQPVSDQIFSVFRRLYDYDDLPLDARVEAVDSTNPHWIRERVSFAAAYGDERVMAYLFLPRDRPPPYHTVVYFPGSGAISALSSEHLGPGVIDFAVKSGRAVLHPIYKSTFERRDSLQTFMPDQSDFYRQHVIWWGKDFKRSVDYLLSRSDIDAETLGYFGASWGGRLGPIMLAIEPRIKAAVLYVAGLRAQRKLPEADPFNFLPRVTVPVLMVNGRYDPYFPVETSQEPMFRLLGTPDDQKRHLVDEGGHYVARVLLVRETLDWFDRYLGPVE